MRTNATASDATIDTIYEEKIQTLRTAIDDADAILIGAGAGLSTAAGLTYSGERFEKYFADFAAEYGIQDMYSGGFYPFPDEETLWAWWSRHIYVNRYMPSDSATCLYTRLKNLVDGKDYFVLTTNVDHQFQNAGFDKERLFYTQGDYGLFETVPEQRGEDKTDAENAQSRTYDNEEWVSAALEAQGWVKNDAGIYTPPDDAQDMSMRIPSHLIPRDEQGRAVRMNLRIDGDFVEDAGWHAAAERYGEFLRRTDESRSLEGSPAQHVLYLELGVGQNTPSIITYPFWRLTYDNPLATYVTVSLEDAYVPREIADRGLGIDADIAQVLSQLSA
ncbi:Sir2 silent information regulator family NAD-dependent deacetylase [Alloscardovia macacae]|uniref:Sir2 silent information regulator family NAD-dependent deacetylase n=1 Tax=Alloscardovia macacae TaxID=1160091 RepID=A0A261F1P5_9BIFI|nr:Sir2 silent information regulator family NAD-dependent deacetylase [Alloscardovia macacae]OZG53027.1 hypothetical protein ALMA_1329 [Alloscardovia macacae]